jgi:hypothetical protein
MRKILLFERRLLAAATIRAGWNDRDETGAKAAPKAHTEANANAKRVRLRFIMVKLSSHNVFRMQCQGQRSQGYFRATEISSLFCRCVRSLTRLTSLIHCVCVEQSAYVLDHGITISELDFQILSNNKVGKNYEQITLKYDKCNEVRGGC